MARALQPAQGERYLPAVPWPSGLRGKGERKKVGTGQRVRQQLGLPAWGCCEAGCTLLKDSWLKEQMETDVQAILRRP